MTAVDGLRFFSGQLHVLFDRARPRADQKFRSSDEDDDEDQNENDSIDFSFVARREVFAAKRGHSDFRTWNIQELSQPWR